MGASVYASSKNLSFDSKYLWLVFGGNFKSLQIASFNLRLDLLRKTLVRTL